MNKTIFEMIEESCQVLQLPFSSKEFAELAEENAMSEDAAQAVAFIFEHIQQKKAANTILALLRFSRLSIKILRHFKILTSHCFGEKTWTRFATCRLYLQFMPTRI